jgi:hypothetical protein
MLERLTIKTDICIEPENEIVYHNPNDPDGLYNILDLAECLYSGGEVEAGILMEISRRLAAYEDSGLSPEEAQELAQAKADGRLVVLPETGIGDLSDGYHTFNELYHHRAILFSVICNEHPDISWKSKLHHDGTMFDGMFIVGINTPEGQATYHYDINPYWDMFRVRELEKAPEWDGHTSEQAIERIAGFTREAAEKALSPICNTTKLPCAGCNPVCEHRAKS